MSATSTTQNREDEKKFADLIGPTDPQLDRKVRERLVTARVGMLFSASFFGNLATRLKLVNADSWCTTAATDGRNFYYNTRFIEMLRPKEVEFLFGHEVLHCVYDHFGRRGSRDARLYNVAADFCVNADLKKHRVGEFITSVPCLYDPKYEGMSSEEIYDILYENAEKIDINDLLDSLIDEHIDGDDDEGGSGRPKLSQEEREQIRNELKQAMLAAAQSTDAGNLPDGVRRMIQDISSPQMNWRELLRMHVESTIHNDYTWMRPGRKAWHMDAILPGVRDSEAIDIAVAIDLSGSISQEQARDFLGEIKGIMESFDSYRIHVFSFDTDVYNPQQFDSDNLEQIEEYECVGGGGTDFDCIFGYLKDNDIDPKRLVVFTDGYPYGSWGDPNYCETLWVIHSNREPNPPFGQWIGYE